MTKSLCPVSRPWTTLDVYHQVVPKIPQRSTWGLVSDLELSALSDHARLLAVLGIHPLEPYTCLRLADGGTLYVQPPLPEEVLHG